MKNAINFVMLSLMSGLAAAQAGVAVIDTGVMRGTAVPLCRPPLNHTSDPTPFDDVGHGEYVSRLIVETAAPHAACIESHKVVTGSRHLQNYLQALKSIGPRVKIVNISLEPSEEAVRGEYEAFKALLARGVRVVLAAGNKGSKRLTAPCTWYPHCYAFPTHLRKRWHIVSSLKPRPDYSTGELINAWAAGFYRVSPTLIIYGTSFSAPRVAGHLVRGMQ